MSVGFAGYTTSFEIRARRWGSTLEDDRLDISMRSSSLTESQGLSCPVQTSLEQKETKATKRENQANSGGQTPKMSDLYVNGNTFHGEGNHEIHPRNSRRQLR